MTDQQSDNGPQPCPPCRGTGKVVSNLGGSASTVDCPWCDGSGVLTLEHNAQSRWKPGQTSDQDA